MLKRSNEIRISALAISLLIGGALPAGQLALAQAPANPPAQTAPDNSAANKDQGDTAQDQGTSPEDRAIARKLRKAIMDDKSISTYGKNVKIIAREGAVTLKGPVTSEDEKKEIGDLAVQVTGGADKVDNQLTVTPA
jgi:osmotically-inducible protein OsmY